MSNPLTRRAPRNIRMSLPAKHFIPTSRLSVAALALVLAMLGAACQDFYSDSLPTPQVALPTPAIVQDGNPEELVELGARTAMATALGISADAPRKILLQGATWTDRAPGCYPPPPGVQGPYIVPGYRLLLQHEDTYYEYDADRGGTGALCDSTMQPVAVESALDIVTVNVSGEARPELTMVYVLRSEQDVSEFNSANSDIATVAPGVIDWDVEVLVGGWVEIGPATEVVKAYRLPSGSQANLDDAPVLIEVAVPADPAGTGGSGPSQAWVLVDITGPGSTYQFINVRQ